MDLIPSTSIEHLLATREAIVARLRQAGKLVDEAKRLYLASQVGFHGPEMKEPYRHCFESLGTPNYYGREAFDAEAIVRGFDSHAWGFLMGASGLRSFMSADAKALWEKAIRDKDTPELTLGNIQDTFKKLRARRAEMFEDGVVEAFRALSWDYKSNSPIKFGKRLVLKGYRRVDSTMCARIDDLRRVLSVAGGNPEPDHRAGVEAAFSCMPDGATRQFEDDLLKAQAFKNGNVHIEFKRPELVAALNAILASRHPNALPAAPESSPSR